MKLLVGRWVDPGSWKESVVALSAHVQPLLPCSFRDWAIRDPTVLERKNFRCVRRDILHQILLVP